ncbi:MAG: tetratricopeptide repeat protein [Acidobacteriota bacterium]
METPRIGPYEILDTLGRGGMAVVSRARHVETGEIVALKAVDVPEPALLQGLRREIHALASLRHPGVVRIVDEGVDAGLPWYAMELCDGRTLQAFAAARPWREALPALISLCDTLAYVHGEGIVHRDLKPANVLVRSDGMPVLLDFGLASRFGGASSREALQIAGDTMGTAEYLSPEQARGEQVDARADLYALGCILHEIVTGAPPFRGATFVEVLQKHLAEAPEPPSRRVPEIPPELGELIGKLLAKDPADRVGHADDVARVLYALGPTEVPRHAVASSYLYRAGLSGRRESLAAARTAIERMEQGRGGLVIVEGESGVGKTRFLAEVSRLARQRDVRVVACECQPPAAFRAAMEPLAALAGLFDVLADLCRSAPSQDRDAVERILGRGARVLAAYAPSLACLPALRNAEAPPDLPPREARHRLFAALSDALAGLAQAHPLLLVIDDLQWADDLTLAFLQSPAALARWASERVLVAGGSRSDDASGRTAPLRSLPGVDGIELSRLDARGVSRMAADMLATTPPPELVTLLARHSEGNPFFVAEYLRAAVASGILKRDESGRWQAGAGDGAFASLPIPGSLHELVAYRIAGLDQDALVVSQAAAVLGRESDEPLLASLAALPEKRTMDAIALLVKRHVLEPRDAGRLSFVHDKIREVAYDQIVPAARVALHRRAADLVEAHQNAAHRQGELGHHRERAGDLAGARTAYVRAARRATGSHALGDALELYHAALALSSPPDGDVVALRTELATKVLRPRGMLLEARRQCEEALAQARAGGDGASIVASLRALATIQLLAGRLDAALGALEEALGLAETDGDRSATGRVLDGLGSIHRHLGFMEQAVSLAGRAVTTLRDCDDAAGLGNALVNLANLHRDQGRIDAARALYDEALALARATRDRKAEGLNLGNIAVLCQDAGRLEEARARYEEALALSRQIGDRFLESTWLGALAGCVWECAQGSRARSLYLQSLEIAREVGDRRTESVALGNLGAIDEALGHLDAADAELSSAREIARALGDTPHEGILLGAVARVAEARGDATAALRDGERALAILRETGDLRNVASALSDLAFAHIESGALVKARELEMEARALHRQLGNTRADATSGINLARIDAAEGSIDRAREELRQAAIAAADGWDRLEEARALCERGLVELLAGGEATRHLVEARRTATALGVAPASRLGRALARLESSVRSGGRDGPAGVRPDGHPSPAARAFEGARAGTDPALLDPARRASE